ncbi:MAG: glycogen synthase [Planctomycetaceae bacterium]|nr:glycogen synthase [Planctomycetaceae bacterium]
MARDLESLYQAVRTALARYEEQSEAMQEQIVEWGWDRRSRAYFDLFRRLLARPCARRRA